MIRGIEQKKYDTYYAVWDERRPVSRRPKVLGLLGLLGYGIPLMNH